MKLRFYLKSYQANNAKRQIYFEYRAAGDRFRLPVKSQAGIPLKVSPEYWFQNERQRSNLKGVRRTDRYQRVITSHFEAPFINSELDLFEQSVRDICNGLQAQGKKPIPLLVREQLSKEASKTSVLDLFQRFIDTNPNKVVGDSLQNYRYAKSNIEGLNPHITWANFDRSFPRRMREKFPSWSSNTLALRMALIKGFVMWAYREGYHENDIENLWLVKGENKSKEPLTLEEVRMIMEYKPDDFKLPSGHIRSAQFMAEGKDLMLWFIYSGMRVSEYLQLTPDSYNPETNTLHFNKAKQRGGRVVPHSIMMNDYLAELWGAYGGNLPKPGKRSPKSSINHRIKALQLALGIDKPLSSHIGRHTLTTLLQQRTGNTLAVSRLLGHTNTNTLQRHYDHSGSEVGYQLEKDINKLLE